MGNLQKQEIKLTAVIRQISAFYGSVRNSPARIL